MEWTTSPIDSAGERTRAARAARVDAPSSALRARRWAIILSALLSGALVFISMLVDPVPDATGKELIQGYAAHPLRQGVHTNLIHYGFALFAPVAFALVGLVRSRGTWLANVAGLLSAVGLTTLPGLVLIDFHDVATANIAGLDVAVAASDAVGNLPGFLPILIPALLCSLAALPLAAAAAWRAGLVHWSIPLILVASFGLLNLHLLPGRVAFGLLAVGTAALAYALWRIPAERWFGGRETAPMV